MKKSLLALFTLFLLTLVSCIKNESHTLTLEQTDESINGVFTYQLAEGQEGLSGNTITWHEPNNTCRTVIVEYIDPYSEFAGQYVMLDRITICPQDKFEDYQISTQNDSINISLSNDASILNISKK
jgi:hypothetical protein